MKIIGFSRIASDVKMVMKGDSSLLVNRKPFFIPDWSEDVRMTPCVVLRVSRMGKNIAARFASRYYDAVALGLNMQAADFVANNDWTKGWAFDYSLVVGTFIHPECLDEQNMLMSFEEAIQRVSEIMTIRQGDMIFIDCIANPRKLLQDEVICVEKEKVELLYCKIK